MGSGGHVTRCKIAASVQTEKAPGIARRDGSPVSRPLRWCGLRIASASLIGHGSSPGLYAPDGPGNSRPLPFCLLRTANIPWRRLVSSAWTRPWRPQSRRVANGRARSHHGATPAKPPPKLAPNASSGRPGKPDRQTNSVLVGGCSRRHRKKTFSGRTHDYGDIAGSRKVGRLGFCQFCQ